MDKVVTGPVNVSTAVEQSAKAEFLKDFKKDDDDVKEISKDKLAKLDRYQQFEKYFPFYRMDINGYQLLI